MYQKTNLKLSSSDKTIDIFMPDRVSTNNTVVYVLDGEKLIPNLISGFEEGKNLVLPVLVSLSGDNRLNDFTPWPASSLVGHFPDFGGEGNQYISWMENELMPAVEDFLKESGADQAKDFESVLLGYSLGGLLGVYASFKSKAFAKIVSISGSFWYPEWDSFIQNHMPARSDVKYMMAYGNREGLGKKSIQKDAVIRSEVTYRILCQYTKEFPVIVDDGGHHDHLKERLSHAAKWICES